MTAQERAYVQRLQRRAANTAPDLAAAQLRAFDLIRSALPESQVARAIQDGTMDRLIGEILDDRTGGPFAALRARLESATIDAAESEAAHLPGRYRVGVFDRLSPFVVSATRNLSERTIEGLATETREMVREQVRLGIEAGKNPRVIARELKSLIGLAPNQARAVANFREQLETGDRAALDRMLGRGVLRQPDGEIIRRAAHAGGEGLSARDLGLLDRKLGRASTRGPVYYHGTRADFTEFSLEAPKTTAGGFSRHGISLTPDKTVAERYARDFLQPGETGRVLRVQIGADVRLLDLSPRHFERLQDFAGMMDRGQALSEVQSVSMEEILKKYGISSRAGDADVHPVQAIRSAGYGGIARGTGMGGAEAEVLVFDPRAAKILPASSLTPEQIDRMTRAYEKRMLAWNAESHARTMALDANKQANRLAWEDAVAKGIVDRSALRKVWVTVGDDRVRPEHEELNGTEVGFDDAFPNGEVTPGDQSWNCRCVARIVIAQQAVAA